MKIQQTQSVQLPLLGIADTLEIRVNSFPLFPSSIEVFWKVSGDVISKEGTIVLPQEIVQNWGTDDTIVKEYILQQLGLVEDTTPDPVVTPLTPDPVEDTTPGPVEETTPGPVEDTTPDPTIETP